MGKTTIHAKNCLDETQYLLGTVWHNKNNFVMIVKLISEHPNPKRNDEIVVLILDLLTGETEDFIFNYKKNKFEWISLKCL